MLQIPEISNPALRCSRPNKPVNGKLIMPKRSYTIGQSARFACRPSFTMVGDAEVTCMSNNQWSSEAPTCNRKLDMKSL